MSICFQNAVSAIHVSDKITLYTVSTATLSHVQPHAVHCVDM